MQLQTIPLDPPSSIRFLLHHPAETAEVLLGGGGLHVLEEWRTQLEVSAVMLVMLESVHELKITHVSEMFSRVEEIARVAERLWPNTLPNLVHENRARLPQTPAVIPAVDIVLDLSVFSGPVRSLLAACPLPQLERLAHELGRPELAHRCSLAHDWLDSFTHRADDNEQRAHVLARAFVEGRLSLNEIASVLGMQTSDAVHWLELHGHVRALSSFAINDVQRTEALGKLRAERLKRSGQPVLDDDLVRRDVVATQRIEGIDARKLLPPK